jgi:chemotaxis protein CheX
MERTSGMTTLQAQGQLSDEIVAIVGDVWEAFLLGDVAPELDQPHREPALVTCANVCLSGAWTGVLMLECPPDVAALLSAALLGLSSGEPSESDVADTLGELANVIGGNLKNVLPGPTMLSLPVVSRALTPTRVKDAVEVCTVGFRWAGGLLRVIVWRAVPRG